MTKIVYLSNLHLYRFQNYNGDKTIIYDNGLPLQIFEEDNYILITKGDILLNLICKKVAHKVFKFEDVMQYVELDTLMVDYFIYELCQDLMIIDYDDTPRNFMCSEYFKVYINLIKQDSKFTNSFNLFAKTFDKNFKGNILKIFEKQIALTLWALARRMTILSVV